MKNPFISICIPTFERIEFLKKLISNIESQTFKDYEIIISDNSTSDFIMDYVNSLNTPLINYTKNIPSLSMGENWNKCMAKAQGTWLKMMHDDDYFIDGNSLECFANIARKSQPGLIFGQLCFYDNDKQKKTIMPLSAAHYERIKIYPVDLIGLGNRIGNPCNTLIHRDVFKPFHSELKWIIDFEGYIRMLNANQNLIFINKPLVEIFHHSGQLTRDVFLNKKIEVPENNYLMNTYYPDNCKWFFSFDYFWRKIRNLNIRTIEEYKQYIETSEPINPLIYKIISFQKRIPISILKIGYCSKIFSFLFWKTSVVQLKKQL